MGTKWTCKVPKNPSMASDTSVADDEPKSDRKPPDDWDIYAINLITNALRIKRKTWPWLSAEMNSLGYDRLNAKTLKRRVERGGFSAGFYMRVCCVLGLPAIELPDLDKMPKRGTLVSARDAMAIAAKPTKQRS